MRRPSGRQFLLLLAVVILVGLEVLAPPRRPHSNSRAQESAAHFTERPRVQIGTPTTREEQALVEQLLRVSGAGMGALAPEIAEKNPNLYIYFTNAKDRRYYDQSESAGPIVSRIWKQGDGILRARLVVVRTPELNSAAITTGYLRLLGVQERHDATQTSITDADIADLRKLYLRNSSAPP